MEFFNENRRINKSPIPERSTPGLHNIRLPEGVQFEYFPPNESPVPSLRARLEELIRAKRQEKDPDFVGLREWNEKYEGEYANFYLGEEKLFGVIDEYETQYDRVKITHDRPGGGQMVSRVPLRDVQPVSTIRKTKNKKTA